MSTIIENNTTYYKLATEDYAVKLGGGNNGGSYLITSKDVSDNAISWNIQWVSDPKITSATAAIVAEDDIVKKPEQS